MINLFYNFGQPIDEIKISKINAEVLKKEIFINGPVSLCFWVNEDFLHYESGLLLKFKQKKTKQN